MRTPALPETDPRLPRPVALALYGVGYAGGLVVLGVGTVIYKELRFLHNLKRKVEHK